MRQFRAARRAVQENNILRMYVDEAVLNFMIRPDFESRLLASETVFLKVKESSKCEYVSEVTL